MGLVLQYKALRIIKARRKRSAGIRFNASQDIASKHEKAFATAFKRAIKGLLTPDDKAAFTDAWRTRDTLAVMRSLPIFDPVDRKNLSPAHQRFVDAMVRAYSAVINEASDAAAADVSKLTGLAVEVKKAKRKSPKPKAQPALEIEIPRKTVPVVPVNPISAEWMRQRSLELIDSGLGPNQRAAVQQILSDGFARGIRAEEAYASVEQNIGLNWMQSDALERRKELLRAEGYAQADIDGMVQPYADEMLATRAETISRTETFFAQSEGRNQTWKQAMDSGELQNVERVWIAGPELGDPNAPCPICLDLSTGGPGGGGKTAPVGGFYESIDGPIDKPPAHPRCRCTEALQRAESPVQEVV